MITDLVVIMLFLQETVMKSLRRSSFVGGMRWKVDVDLHKVKMYLNKNSRPSCGARQAMRYPA